MSLLDTIDNFYERLVAEAVEASRESADEDDYLIDVMCVALNRLPPRYYRHTIDMKFYMADPEMEEMREKVHRRVREAREFVRNHKRE